MKRRSKDGAPALAICLGLGLVWGALMGCEGTPGSERGAPGSAVEESEPAALTGEFSLQFPGDQFSQVLAEVSCEIVPSPQGDVVHVIGYGESGAEGREEPVLNLRLPGVTVGQGKVYNERLLPAFYGSAILRNVELRGAEWARLELAAGPVPGTAGSYGCELTTSPTEAWNLRCTDFAPLNWSAPGGRPLAILEAEFRCF